jgi:hypothetical protein
VLHQPNHVDAPALLARWLVAKALERNPNLDFISVLGEPALRLEDEVRAQVSRLSLDHGVVEAIAAGGSGFHQRTVRLHTEGIYGKDSGLAAVVERAQEYLDVIVRGDAIPVGQCSMD